jgi:hypothetical protein
MLEDEHAPLLPSVTYHFPVEVEIIGELSAPQRLQLAQHVYEELEAALRARS